MWTDPDLYTWLWTAFWAGVILLTAGGVLLVATSRRAVVMGPLPRKLAAPPQRRIEEVATEVVARIPGATPAQQEFLDAIDQTAELTDELLHRVADGMRAMRGPVCPVCGGPFHPVCPSTPKVVLRQVPGPTVEELEALARAACPLTAETIPTVALHNPNPDYEAAERRRETRDLTVDIAKILEAAP